MMENDNINSEEQNLEENDCQENAQMTEKEQCEEEKLKKGSKKNLERLLKNISMQSAEEKLHVICEEYSKLYEENKKLQATVRQNDRKINNLQKEKKQLQDEQSKSLLIRKRLESLCRELQKEKDYIKKEGFSKIKEQEHSQKALSNHLYGGIAQLTALTNFNTQKNVQLTQERAKIEEKCRDVCEQMVVMQQDFKILKHVMKVDAELADEKITKLSMQAAADTEAFLREKHQLLCKIKEYQEQIRELQAVENNLRSEINVYSEKYDEFQNLLSRSDKIYAEFNQEIQRMSQKILTLEKETAMWKEQSAKNHNAVLAVDAEKQARDEQIAKLNKEFASLQNICRALQRERKAEAKKKSLKPESETPSAETISQTSQKK